ncbi:hypothetical protein [Mycobacterium sp.]|uniref:hypothetical protein n=1 Tax=Mycobacterium sp. TaxID=1785 RepID=UPI001288E25C|nr:hypothetical protein [Mycobacterium sp.]KAA8969660.1 MAG: hypothetical protein F6Q13_02560 [Mycobacterium sp.]
MKRGSSKGRIAGLATGLGIAAALAATPGTAAADTLGAATDDVWAAAASAAGSDPLFDPNIALSIDGLTFATGTATATSGLGDIALAVGPNSSADASGGLLDIAAALGGQNSADAVGNVDIAYILGAGSTADVTGNVDIASILGAEDSIMQPGSIDLATLVGNGLAPVEQTGNVMIDLATALFSFF